MTFYSGLLAPSLTPAADYMAVLETALLAEGFTLEATLGSGTVTVKVYKSAQAVNGVMDWYLYVRRPSNSYTTTNITLLASESFDGTNATNVVCGTQSVIPNGSWATGASIAIGTTVTGMYSVLSMPVHRSGLEYWHSVNPQRVIVAARHHALSSDDAGYAGLFDSMVPGWTGPDLTVCRFVAGSQSSVSYGSTSRDPFQTLAHAYNFFVYTAQTSPNGPSMNTSVDAYLGRSMAAPTPIYASRSAASVRGQLKDVMSVASNGGPGVLGAISGDEILVADIYGNEETYVSFNQNGYNQGFYVRKDA